MSPRSLSLVVAYTLRTRAIGLRKELPWPRLSKDLSRMKALTYGHAVVMGRGTFESAEVGGVPLPGRRNVVLSRDICWVPPQGVVHAADWSEALLLADAGFGGAGYDDGAVVMEAGSGRRRCVFVLGGEQVYRCALAMGDVERVFATEIEGDYGGDAFFPQLEPDRWRRIGDPGGEGFKESRGPEFCPKGWAAAGPMYENGVTYRFVTYERVRVPEVELREGQNMHAHA